MIARHRANRENTIILAHQIEAMARQKTLRNLASYLRDAPKKRSGTDPALFAALEKAKAKGLVRIRERK